ncbi:reverse transcriptase domain-containing protein [Tanacetum coccineum]
MPLRMMTRSTSRGGATPKGGRTDARRGRGYGRGHNDNGDIGNGNNDNIGNSGESNTDRENNEEGCKQGNPKDGSNNNNGNGCSYKEFLACQPKEFDGKGGTIAYTRWVEKMESMIDMSNCAINQRVKYIYGLVHEIRGMVLATEPTTIQSSWNMLWKKTEENTKISRLNEEITQAECFPTPVHSFGEEEGVAGGLTDNAVRNGLLKRSSKKRKESGKTCKQEDASSNYKRDRAGKGFVLTDFGKKEYKVLYPKYAKCSYHHQETTPCHTCFNCKQLGHMAKDCRTLAKRVMPVNAINSANNPRVCYKCGSLDNFSNSCLKIIRASGQVHNNPNQVLAIGGTTLTVIRIPLSNGETLDVHGERLEENLKHLANMKTDKKKLEDILIVRDFPKVFPEDLPGLPPL